MYATTSCKRPLGLGILDEQVREVQWHNQNQIIRIQMTQKEVLEQTALLHRVTVVLNQTIKFLLYLNLHVALLLVCCLTYLCSHCVENMMLQPQVITCKVVAYKRLKTKEYKCQTFRSESGGGRLHV